MFIKFGDYYFESESILVVKQVGAGVRVYLKTGLAMDVANIDGSDWEIFIKTQTIQKR